jgi:hypothetical protein
MTSKLAAEMHWLRLHRDMFDEDVDLPTLLTRELVTNRQACGASRDRNW